MCAHGRLAIGNRQDRSRNLRAGAEDGVSGGGEVGARFVGTV